MIRLRRTGNWPSSLSSLTACLLACTGSLHAPSPGHPVAQAAATGGEAIVADASSGTGGSAGLAPARDALDVTEALPLAQSPTEAYPPDAQIYLLGLVRSGRPLFVRRIQPGGAACVPVELRPSLPDGSAGELVLGDEKGRYLVRDGNLRLRGTGASRALAFDETWPVHGTTRDGVLLSGALFSTSKEACEADSTHRPLALLDGRRGGWAPGTRERSADTGNMPWVLNGRGMIPSSYFRLAGAYFSNGIRYPFELFAPLAKAWITGPLAGGSGQPRIVDYRLDSGHLRLGDVVLDHEPILLDDPPADAEPALVETGAHDFVRDFLAEKRTLHVPLWREGGVECAPVDMSKLRGTFTVPTYSGGTRNLEYVKEDQGIAVWHATFHQGLPGGGIGGTIAVCDHQPDYFSIHGRDADSYHVSGSRWFFDGAECERQRKHVLPSLVHVVNVESDACGRADARLVARPSGELRAGKYYVRPRGRRSCVSIEVVGHEGAWPQSWDVRVRDGSSGSGLESFTYEDVARGRFLWRTSPDSLDGELLEMKPFKHGVQVGNTRWYRDKASCTRAAQH
jgi:hypothetical protein